MKNEIIVTGVGGQGIIMTTAIIGRAAVKKGLGVRSAETHGMAQRGGSVVSHLRLGNVLSPLINEGCADFLIAFEPVEAVRYSHFLKKDGYAVVNTESIPPTGSKKVIGPYPPVVDILDSLLEHFKTIPIDGAKLSSEAGNLQTVNVALIGALSVLDGFLLSEDELKQQIKELVPPKTVEMNLRAFELGKKEAEGYRC